jgi:hypothetical protein
MRETSGSFPSGVGLAIQYFNSGTYVTNSTNTASNPAGTALNTQRSYLNVTVPSNTTNLFPYAYFNLASGASVNVTLRIGLPQLEQGLMQTSAIPTSGTALTRSADKAVVNSTSWYGSGQGTLAATAMAGYLYDNSTANTQQVAVSLEADANDKISVRRNPSGSTTLDGLTSGINYQGGTAYPNASGGSGSWSELTSETVVIGYESGSNAVSGAGTQYQTSSGSYTAFTPNQLVIGASAYYGSTWNGWIELVQYYGTRLTNAQVTQLSTGSGLP